MEKAEYTRKLRELKTAKLIRDNSYSCAGIPAFCSKCSREKEGCCLSPDESKAYWDDFIAAREAELALECAKGVSEFKPFDKVLVRDRDGQVWRCDFFSHMDTEEEGVPFATVCAYWKQCIPYAGNEHLVGTTVDYNG